MALQKLRRRVHKPLVSMVTFDLDAAAQDAAEPVTYAIHADPSDDPVARRVEKIFKQAGHTRVFPQNNPQKHIAILSNRSSEAWVKEVTQAYFGNLVFIVVSTVEFKESLTETGRYQWVDARDADRREIIGLARSLGGAPDWKREAALETKPAMIDRWRVPGGTTILKRMIELFGTYLLLTALSNLAGFALDPFIPAQYAAYKSGGGSISRSIVLGLMGAACFWLAGRALVYRKVTAAATYLLFGAIVVAGILPGMPGLLPDSLRDPWWLVPAAIILVLLFTAWSGYFWLPAAAQVNRDEVGIKKSIDRAFRRRNVIIMSAWLIGIVGFCLWELRWMIEKSP